MVKQFCYLFLLVLLFFHCGESRDEIILPTPKEQTVGSITSNYVSGYYSEDIRLKFSAIKKGDLYYTLNGKRPRIGSEFTYKLEGDLNTSSINSTGLFKEKIALGEDKAYHPWKEGYTLPVKGHSIKIARFKDEEIQEIAIFNYVIGPYRISDIASTVMINTDENGLIDQDTGIFAIGDTTKGYKKWKENYFQKGKNWKRACNFQYFDEKGDLKNSTNAALAVSGYTSRFNPQKGIKFFAKKKYGAKYFKYPFFEKGPESFKTISLRSAFGGWNRGINKDYFVSEACLDLQIENPRRKPVTVFLNGEYWGIYFLSEKADQHFVRSKTSAKEEEINIVKDNSKVSFGSAKQFKLNQTFGFQNDLGIDSNYAVFCKDIDINNYIDWTLTELFFQNKDWPCNNTKLWSSKSSPKLRHFFIDFDACIQSPKDNYFERLLLYKTKKRLRYNNRCSFIFMNLLRNENFKIKLQKRLHELVTSHWSSERLMKIYNQQRNEIHKRNFLAYQKIRWKYPEDDAFDQFEEDLGNWIEIRPEVVEENLASFLKEYESKFTKPFQPCSFVFK